MSNLKTQNENSNVKIRAYKFSLSIINFIGNLPNNKTYWVFSDQLLRSSTSIGANIVEASSSSSRREFVKYYEISLKSANETKYWLCLLRDSNLVKVILISPLLTEVTEIAKMLGSSVLTLKGKNKI